MKIGFISPFVPGHLNPMTTLARQLQSRSHDVVYIASPAAEAVIRAYELPFVSFGETEQQFVGTESFKSLLAQLSKLQGEDATRLVLQVMASRTETMLHCLPTVLAEEGIDALVFDTYQFYAELVPMPERRKSLGRRQTQAIPVRTYFSDTFQNCFLPHEPRYVPSEACAFGNTRPGKYRGSSSAKSLTPIRPSRAKSIIG